MDHFTELSCLCLSASYSSVHVESLSKSVGTVVLSSYRTSFWFLPLFLSERQTFIMMQQEWNYTKSFHRVQFSYHSTHFHREFSCD